MTGQRRIQVATGALAMLFVGPSCVTAMLWRDRYSPTATDETVLAVSADADAPLEFTVATGALSSAIAARYQTSTTAWLRLRPTEHVDSLRTMLAKQPPRTPTIEMPPSTGNGLPPVIDLTFWLDPFRGGETRLGGASVEHGLYKSWHLRVPCTVEPSAAPAPGSHTRDAEVQLLDPAYGLFTCIAGTPITVAIDVVLSPFQLMMLFAD